MKYEKIWRNDKARIEKINFRNIKFFQITHKNYSIKDVNKRIH